ncbi:MAG: type VI secretion system contractile sheath large subunit [Acidobacteriota bacterium]|nr:type VI secretion system contractile sheath large subunit [Acidobacteriota bacterium]
MPDRHSFGEIHLDVTVGRERAQAKATSETPFRIAILGDFSGRGNRRIMETGEALANRRPVLVDRDNYDSVFAKMSPHLDLLMGGKDSYPITLKFADMEEFHPDSLFRQVQLFQKLRDIREKLGDSETFAETASALGIKGTPPAPTAPVETQRSPSADVQQAVSGNLLDQMLEETEQKADQPRASRIPDPWTSLLRRIVAPHVVPKADPRQGEALKLLDLATSAQMGALLHLPEFQALESAWRAVFFLVRNLETSSRLKVLLIDISKEELSRDLASSEDLTSTGIYRLLVEKTVGTPGSDPWAILAGNYTFDSSREDIELLGRMAKVAAAAGAPFITAASPDLLGCKSIADLPDRRKWTMPPAPETAAAWTALRSLPEARYLGLTLPRFLIRLPYGKDTESTEFFAFEEVPDAAAHDDFLWANPAFAAVLLLAQTFTEQGWELRAGTLSDITGLPIHVYTEDGETRSKPCAEVLMTQTAAEEMIEKGFMPLASLKDQAVVRLVRFQSLANPPSALAGRWSP